MRDRSAVVTCCWDRVDDTEYLSESCRSESVASVCQLDADRRLHYTRQWSAAEDLKTRSFFFGKGAILLAIGREFGSDMAFFA